MTDMWSEAEDFARWNGEGPEDERPIEDDRSGYENDGGRADAAFERWREDNYPEDE